MSKMIQCPYCDAWIHAEFDAEHIAFCVEDDTTGVDYLKDIA